MRSGWGRASGWVLLLLAAAGLFLGGPAMAALAKPGVRGRPAAAMEEAPAPGVNLTKIRTGVHPGHTRVVLEMSGGTGWSVRPTAEGALLVSIPRAVVGEGVRDLAFGRGVLRGVRVLRLEAGVEVRLDTHPAGRGYRTLTLKNPDRLVVDLLEGVERPREAAPTARPERQGPVPEARPAEAAAPAAREVPAASPAPPPTREPEAPAGGPALTVVLDPGHGGHDTGAIGPTGLLEKDVVLDVALRLRRLLEQRLKVRVLMTRTEDVFVPLPERAAAANRAKADFFLSLHLNGAQTRGVVGAETFFFAREPSDNDARASAQRENLVLESNGTAGKDQESLLKITLADMAVTRDIKESGTLAELLLASMDRRLKVENRGVKSGPFYVLATAAMPAVLVESAFITNPREEQRLQREEHRQRIAEALFDGVARYKTRYEQRVGVGRPPLGGLGS